MLLSPAPKIVVVDNDRGDLEVLTGALSQCNVTYRAVLYPDDIQSMEPNSHVRIMFFDFNLREGTLGADISRHYEDIGGLIGEGIRPNGPYFVVLWTVHDDQAVSLFEYLNAYLSECPKPLAVLPLKKTDLLMGQSGRNRLIEALEQKIASTPEIAALLAWEAKVMEATGETVADVARLAREACGHNDVSTGLSMLLCALAVGAVGKDNVSRGRFRAVNRALVPILADRMSTLGIMAEQGDDTEFGSLWKDALGGCDGRNLAKEVVASLNGVSLIATGTGEHPSARGVVIRLKDVFDVNKFRRMFDVEPDTAAETQFGCPRFGELENASHQWVLIQAQAACDEAQRRPGPIPFYLGLEVPIDRAGNRKAPQACWRSPVFRLTGDAADRILHVNVRFGIFVRRQELRAVQPMYRLRAPLLGDLSHHIHSYGARPGIISFR